jgi:hypothetical protein
LTLPLTPEKVLALLQLKAQIIDEETGWARLVLNAEII